MVFHTRPSGLIIANYGAAELHCITMTGGPHSRTGCSVNRRRSEQSKGKTCNADFLHAVGAFRFPRQPKKLRKPLGQRGSRKSSTSARYLPPLLLIAHFCVQLLMQLLTVPIPCVLHGPVLQNSSHVFFCANAGNELRARLIAAINIIGLSMFHPPS
jgi:hypothetical protein